MPARPARARTSRRDSSLLRTRCGTAPTALQLGAGGRAFVREADLGVGMERFAERGGPRSERREDRDREGQGVEAAEDAAPVLGRRGRGFVFDRNRFRGYAVVMALDVRMRVVRAFV